MTAKELEEQGWVKENETTWGRPDSTVKQDAIQTDTDRILIKEQGRDDVYK